MPEHFDESMGYKPLTDEQAESIKTLKELEVFVEKQVSTCVAKAGCADPRKVALAKTNIEQGFMWAVKAASGK